MPFSLNRNTIRLSSFICPPSAQTHEGCRHLSVLPPHKHMMAVIILPSSLHTNILRLSSFINPQTANIQTAFIYPSFKHTNTFSVFLFFHSRVTQIHSVSLHFSVLFLHKTHLDCLHFFILISHKHMKTVIVLPSSLHTNTFRLSSFINISTSQTHSSCLHLSIFQPH